MSAQSTYKNQALHEVGTVTATDCETPIDTPVPGETDGWTRIKTYEDVYSNIYPYKGWDQFVGGFRYTRRNLNQPQEVLVFHFTNPQRNLECTSSNTSQWVVIWTDTHSDWEHKLDTFHRTPSLHNARKVTATFLTNIPRADMTEPDWREGIAEITNQITTISVEQYNNDHAEALREHVPWSEKRKRLHRRARNEFDKVKQYRSELLEELKQDVKTDEERGYHTRKALPIKTDRTAELTKAFVSDELTLDEFETKIEEEWENTDMLPFEDSLVKHLEETT